MNLKEPMKLFRNPAAIFSAVMLVTITSCTGKLIAEYDNSNIKSPSGLQASAVSSSQIDISWRDNSFNEDGFLIEQAPAMDGPWTFSARVPANMKTCKIIELNPETKYFYRVMAYNSDGESEFSGTASATTGHEAASKPAVPYALNALPLSSSAIFLSWSDNSDNEDGFIIEKAPDNAGSPGSWTILTKTAAGTESYNNTGLAAETRYYYRIKSYNAAGESGYTAIAGATTLQIPLTAPSSPSGLTASAVSSSIINLTWNDNSGNEDEFIIERAPDNAGSPGTWNTLAAVSTGINTYQDSGLAAVTTYHYRIKARNTTGDSDYANAVSATTQQIPLSPPSAPSGLTAAAVSYSEISLSWSDNSGNEDEFIIERAPDNAGSPGTWGIIKSVSAGVNTYQDSGLEAETRYYYRIKAGNTAGESDYTAAVNAITQQIPLSVPSSPSGLTATALSSSVVSLLWNDNSDNETQFLIERAPDNGGSYGTWLPLTTVSPDIITWQDSGLAAETKYYYRIKARNSAGDSAYTPAVSVTTQQIPVTIPINPSNLNASAASSTSISLTWTDNSSNELSFLIERAPDTDGNPGTWSQIISTPANVTSYIDSSLSASTKYHYRISANNSAGYSGLSNTASATTSAADISARIIADHTVVDRYDDIPDKYIAIVKTYLVDIAGESHSKGYRIGMDLLELRNSKYAVQTFDGTIPGVSTSNLRLGRHGTVGEAEFYTNSTALASIRQFITSQNTNSNPLNVIGFGWCWDMTWQNSPGGTKDPVYGVRWTGSSAGGPQGNLIWGLDSGDQSLTGNSVCMDTYLNAVMQYINHCTTSGYSCRVIFTTGPVDGNAGTENGFQREIKHNYIREYVANNPGTILFDYADILCWNNSGVKNTVNWNDGGTLRPHAQIHNDNMMDYDSSWNIIAHTEDGDHIGEVGTERLAKAMWWMLARIAGWDGVSSE